MARVGDLLFVGTHGHITAMSKKHGRKVWSTSLPKTGYDVVTLLHEDGLLFAGSSGHLFALDAATGDILWSNGLKGLGHGAMLLATARAATDQAVTLAAVKAKKAVATGAGGVT